MDFQEYRLHREIPDDQPCRIVVLYEDDLSRDHAIGVCDHLQQQFKEDVALDISWWKFNFLSDPRIAQQFIDAIPAADLIFVSVDNSDQLPFAVKSRFETALAKRTKLDGAIALLKSTPASIILPCPLTSYLEALAQHAGLDFFPVPFSAPVPVPIDPLEEQMHVVIPLVIPTPEIYPSHQARDWGINE